MKRPVWAIFITALMITALLAVGKQSGALGASAEPTASPYYSFVILTPATGTPIPTLRPTPTPTTAPTATPTPTPRPTPRPTVAPTPRAAPGPGGLAGLATWYRYHPGQAAAGPRLRLYLGPHWRGTTVVVCGGHGDVCFKVVLTDWCLCTADGARRIIDLDRSDFEQLTGADRGRVTVTVSRH